MINLAIGLSNDFCVFWRPLVHKSSTRRQRRFSIRLTKGCSPPWKCRGGERELHRLTKPQSCYFLPPVNLGGLWQSSDSNGGVSPVGAGTPAASPAVTSRSIWSSASSHSIKRFLTRLSTARSIRLKYMSNDEYRSST